jgi:hypothetical protein
MTKDELFAKFPEMTLVDSAPSMFLLNGCGLTVYGKRDRDAETGTYVKTHCLALIFVPVLALSAYRVADDGGGGWYFIGRVPLSGFAKLWNLCVAGLLAGVISLGYMAHYTSTPEYKAEQELAKADELRAAGDMKRAVQIYEIILEGQTPSVAPAGQRLTELLRDDLPKAPLQTIAGIVQAVATDRQAQRLDPGLYDRLLALVKEQQDKDPINALELCNRLKPLAKDAKAHEALRVQLLEKAVAKDPQNVALVCQVAAACEERGETERCVKLLEPVRAKLGITEGARILGQIYARQDRCEDSYQLLMPYTEGRLKRLHDAEKSYDSVLKGLEKSALSQLNKGQGPNAFYRDYKQLEKAGDKAGMAKLVDDFISGKIKSNKQVEGALANLRREAEIVPVALDLGIVRLRRAQDMTDPATRKKELEGAEKVFLDIQGVAGATDEFRIFNGQVKYWLGKHDEGKTLFDQYLESKKRDVKSLLTVSEIMREVGEMVPAREMAEQAYEKATIKEEKAAAAQQRALIWKDLDDEVLWLGRCDASLDHVQASLASARGKKALRDQRKEEAAEEFRKAMQAYLAMPKSSTTLNNAAIEAQNLYAATGHPEDFTRSDELLEEACQLEPKNSILLSNLCNQLEEGVSIQVLADALDWKALDLRPTLGTLDLLYQDEAGHQAWRAKYAAHPHAARICSNREKLTVLAPKSLPNYSSLLGRYHFMKDLEALRALHRRVLGQTFTASDSLQDLRDFYAGKKDEQNRKSLTQALEKYAKVVAGRTGDKPDRVRGVARCLWASFQLEALDLDMPVDLNEVVQWLEQAEAEAPCARTKRQLAMALLERAAIQVGKEQKQLAEMLRRGRRAHSTGDILGLAVENVPAVRDALVRHPDFTRAMGIRKELRQALPNDVAEWEWALLHASDPAEMQIVAKRLREEECGRLATEIQLHLFPYSASVVMDQYWYLQAEGKADAARALLVGLSKQGIPLPFDP